MVGRAVEFVRARTQLDAQRSSSSSDLELDAAPLATQESDCDKVRADSDASSEAGTNFESEAGLSVSDHMEARSRKAKRIQKEGSARWAAMSEERGRLQGTAQRGGLGMIPLATVMLFFLI